MTFLGVLLDFPLTPSMSVELRLESEVSIHLPHALSISVWNELKAHLLSASQPDYFITLPLTRVTVCVCEREIISSLARLK